jgi:hypothetical protein
VTWLKLDDAMGDHRKTRRLLRSGGLGAFGLHALALLHCAKYLTDGFVEQEFVDEAFTDGRVRAKERTRMIEQLVACGQWDAQEGGWQIHDYLAHNPSRAEVEAKRKADAERKARGRRSGSSGSPAGVQAESARTDDGLQEESERPVPSRPDPSSSSLRSDDVDPDQIDEVRERLQAEADLFAHWQELCHHEQAKFSKERRSCIRARRRVFSDDQLRRAIYGASIAAYIDDSGKRHDDLTLVFRNDSKVEDFIERADRHDGLAQLGHSSDDYLAAVNRVAAKAAAAGGMDD